MTTSHDHLKLRFALSFAAAEIPILPLHTPTPGRIAYDGSPRPCSCNKPLNPDGTPQCNVGKHPRTPHGSKDATTSAEQVQAWWRTWSDANLGVATGHEHAAGGYLAILDIDPRHGGDQSFAFLVSEMPPLPSTFTVRTGSGGRHLYFRTRYPVHNRDGIRPGVDVRGISGYGVGPGSVHACGGIYEPVSGSIDDIAMLPEPWLGLIAGPTGPTAGERTEATPTSEWIDLVTLGVGEGKRNGAVTRLAGHLLASRVHPRVALALVQAWNTARNQPPLDSGEVERTVRSIAQRELAKRQEAQR